MNRRSFIQRLGCAVVLPFVPLIDVFAVEKCKETGKFPFQTGGLVSRDTLMDIAGDWRDLAIPWPSQCDLLEDDKTKLSCINKFDNAIHLTTPPEVSP